MHSVTSQFIVSRTTIFLSYLTQFFQYGTGVLILPIILNKLATETIGIWYTFLSIFSLVSLLDFGFSSSFQRFASYVFSGANELLKEGFSKTNNNEIDGNILYSLIYTRKSIYKRLSIVIFIIMIVIGSLYFRFVVSKELLTFKFAITWLLYATTTAFYFYYSWILSFVRGRGQMHEFNYIVIISKSCYIVVLFVLIIFDFALMSLVVANLVNILVMILMGYHYFYDDYVKSILQTVDKKPVNYFNIIWKNARNSGIVSIGVFLLSQAGVFLSNFFLPLSEVAQLGITLQIFGVIVILSRVYLTTNIPKISSMWINYDIRGIKKLFIKSQLVGYFIYIPSCLLLLIVGDFILTYIIHSSVLLPSLSVLLLYMLFYFMEITHGNCCTLISTSNRIPFTKASIFAGIISVILTISFALAGLGIISFPLALCCGSLPYNSWKWPYIVYKILKTNGLSKVYH